MLYQPSRFGAGDSNSDVIAERKNAEAKLAAAREEVREAVRSGKGSLAIMAAGNRANIAAIRLALLG